MNAPSSLTSALRLMALVLAGTVLACAAPSRDDDEDDGESSKKTGEQTTTNSVTGTVNGKAFTARSSMAARFTTPASEDEAGSGNPTPPNNQHLVIRINESAESCDHTGSLPLMQLGARLVHLSVRGTSAPGEGEHDGRVEVYALPGTGGCGGSLEPFVLERLDFGDATVKVTAVSPTFKGTFTATLDSGATLTGKFDAPVCSFDWEQDELVRCVD